MCKFTLPFQGSAADLVARAKKGIEDAGGHFEGNTSAGSFGISLPVTIEGNYTISGQNITIEITKKPFFVSCSRIESELKKLLGSSADVQADTLKSSVTAHADDILAHINHPTQLSARATSAKGCITILDHLEICYQLQGDSVKVCAELKTPVGSVSLGCVTLTSAQRCATLGGHVGGFKAEVTVCVDFSKLTLTIEGKVCVPIFGCHSGSTSIHL